MASNAKVAQAYAAMREIGINEEKVKPVLEKLLELYENSWELIEEENYRVLADAIFDEEDTEVYNVSNQKNCNSSDEDVPFIDDIPRYAVPLAVIHPGEAHTMTSRVGQKRPRQVEDPLDESTTMTEEAPADPSHGLYIHVEETDQDSDDESAPTPQPNVTGWCTNSGSTDTAEPCQSRLRLERLATPCTSDSSVATPELAADESPAVGPSSDDDGIASSLPRKRAGRGMAKGDPVATNRTNRIWIRMTDQEELPENVNRTISTHLKKYLMGPYTSWGTVPQNHRAIYWATFTSVYQWEDQQEARIKIAWEKLCNYRFRRAMNELKTKCAKKNFQEKPLWLNDDLWSQLLTQWGTDKHVKASNIGKQNRAKGPQVTHTGGSRGIQSFMRKLQEKNPENQPPTWMEIYHAKHTRPGQTSEADCEWVSDRARDIYVQYEAGMIEKYGSDRTKWPREVDGPLLAEVSGGPKKGHQFGLRVMQDPESVGIPYRKRQPPFSDPRSWSSTGPSQEQVLELRQIVEHLQSELHEKSQRWAEEKQRYEAEQQKNEQFRLNMEEQMRLLQSHLGLHTRGESF
ncbi:hypothetical protein SLEP1_g768 [Rubroshorea leprosula]|uniref:WIYLD domain-containing protein n=1 Tax=Rubroshorea leprosula TaxID=152421 RepID=A0AAV5HH96_9ROSI|nr:hypothetical protein SLEP1_g768 [Rubroshorea leprosula]